MATGGFGWQLNGAHTRDATISSVTTIARDSGFPNADTLLIQPFSQNVYLTFDGTTPSATNGFELTAGTLYPFDVGQDVVIKVIEKTATATIQWQWFRQKRDTDA